MDPLDCEFRIEPDGDQSRHVVVGEIDQATAPMLRDHLERATASGEGDVVVDLTGVSYIDSSGLNVLVAIANSLADAGRKLSVVPSSQARRLFEITNTEHLLHSGGDASTTPAAAHE